MKWVAKCSEHLGDLFDYNLSPIFDNVYDCQKFIDDNLKDINDLLFQAYNRILFLYGKLCFGGSFIRCYNLTQKRWVSSFDF